MKIIQVYQTNPFINSQGGGARYLRNLSSSLDEKKIEVLFLGIGEFHQKKGNVELYPITKNISGYVKFLFNLMVKLPFLDLSDYKLVHVHRLYFAIPFILFKPRLKIVCTLHGRTFSVFRSNHGKGLLKVVLPIFKAIEKFSIKHIDMMVAVSQDVINSFSEKYSEFKNRQKIIIGSMVDLESFRVDESRYLQDRIGREALYILFLGRLSDVKDIEFLIRLWENRFQSSQNLKLIIAGDGEKRNILKHSANEKCKKNPPIFIGEVHSSEVKELISSSKMVVLCSKHEASPTVVKESLSCGIPVITNNVGDVESFVKNHKNGFVVDKDYGLYDEAIRKILAMNLSKDSVANFSEAMLRKNSCSYITDKYIEIYNNL